MNLEENRALGLTIRGDWGHFRRIDTTSVKQSYRIMPRTTIAGLLAGIVGQERNSYYDIFAHDSSAIGVSVVNPINVMRMSELELTTNANALRSIKGVPARRIMKRETTAEERQRNIYEWLKNPAYRIWVTMEDDEFYSELKSHLEAGTTTYTPTLGKSECLATIEYEGEATLEPSNDNIVDSAVAADQVTVDNSIRVERVPAYNELKEEGRGRRLSGMVSLAYNTDGDSVSVTDTEGIYTVETNNTVENVRFI